MLANLVYLAILFLLILSFVIGLILFLIGIFRANRKNGFTISGAIVGGIPLFIIIIWLTWDALFNSLATKPSQVDIVGVYKISEVTKRNIDKSVVNSYSLVLKSDSTFILTPLLDVEAPDSGHYLVNFDSESNELVLYGENAARTVCINRNIGSFNIEFFIGDPDSGESYYFEKVK